MDISNGKMLSDEVVIHRIRKGDIHLFELLLRRYQDIVLSIAKRHVPLYDVEEIAQEVFIRAYKSLAKIRKPEYFKAWLSSIAVRACYDYWRRQYSSKEILFSQLPEAQQLFLDQLLSEQSNASWEQAVRQKEIEALMTRVLGMLSPAERMVVELVYLEGLSMKETARLTGWSTAGVKVRVFRAKKSLKI